MNDITALTQRIPERKRHDWSQSVMRDCDFCNQWALTVKHEDGARICASCCDAEYTSKLEVANTALVEALEKAQQKEDIYDMLRVDYGLREKGVGLSDFVDWQAKRIAELESRTVTVKPNDVDHVREEGNQFLVVRHPGKTPVIKHPIGELEEYLLQILKADPLATIDIITHRYYGVGGQWVEDADEYLASAGIQVIEGE